MTLLIVLYWKRFGLNNVWAENPIRILSSEEKVTPPTPIQPSPSSAIATALSTVGVTGWQTRGEIFWNRDPGSPFFYVVCFFFGNRAPTDIKKNLSQSAEKPQGRQRGSPSGRESAPDAFTVDQIGLNAPFQASLKKSPTRGLSCVRPRMKGKPQSLA